MPHLAPSVQKTTWQMS